MNIYTFYGLLTVLMLILFLGIVAWAYSSKRKPGFDEAAQLPLEENRDNSNHNRREDKDHE